MKFVEFLVWCFSGIRYFRIKILSTLDKNFVFYNGFRIYCRFSKVFKIEEKKYTGNFPIARNSLHQLIFVSLIQKKTK